MNFIIELVLLERRRLKIDWRGGSSFVGVFGEIVLVNRGWFFRVGYRYEFIVIVFG